jgi:glycosyltransferase involved in cell wall biosynthesis
MKILIITNGTLPVPSAKGGAVENLVNSFIDINEVSNDFQLTVFTVSHDKAIHKAKAYRNTQFIFIKSESIFYKLGRGIRFLVNRIKGNTLKNQFIHEVLKFKNSFREVDLILLENNPSFAECIKRVTRKTVGLHLHNDYINVDNKPTSIKILQHLDFVVGVSQYIKDRVSEIKPKSCHVDFVYNGINLERFGSKESLASVNKFQDKYGINKNEVVILFTGRVQESKGVKLLIESFIELSNNYNLKLIIVGSSGFEGSRKSHFIKELELLSLLVPTKIVFAGYIPYSEIHHIYNLADFAVFPSLATEAFSLTTIEALASGLPVIVTDAGGMPEVIDNDCGFVIKRDAFLKEDLIKKMEILIVDKALRDKMAIEAKNRALLFSDKIFYTSLAHCLKSYM